MCQLQQHWVAFYVRVFERAEGKEGISGGEVGGGRPVSAFYYASHPAPPSCREFSPWGSFRLLAHNILWKPQILPIHWLRARLMMMTLR